MAATTYHSTQVEGKWPRNAIKGLQVRLGLIPRGETLEWGVGSGGEWRGREMV